MKKLTLLIPVYNGGGWFRECLDSLLPHLHCFGHIIVSINKSPKQEEDIATFEAFKKQAVGVVCKSLIQKRMTSGTVHLRYITLQLRHEIGDDFWFFLCHDDILLPSFFEVYAHMQPFLRNDVAINPGRSFFRESFVTENFAYTSFGSKVFENGIDVDAFINQDLDRHYITNVSGVIYPKTSRTYIMALQSLLLFGYRSEYIMLTGRGIRTIYTPPEPMVGIRLHANQQGSQQHPIARRWDEYVYMVHAYCRARDPFLCKKILARFLVFRVLQQPHVYFAKACRRVVRTVLQRRAR